MRAAVPALQARRTLEEMDKDGLVLIIDEAHNIQVGTFCGW
jgi:hypothetical protein